MDSIQPWMRLKVKRDTFFLPDADGTVYFRNNVGSFRMEGTGVQSWIEKLLPVFDGRHTVASLTDELPTPYLDRIYEIAGILYENGFLRDVSTDDEHQLSDKVVQYFEGQIEFLDNLIGSGGYRFQAYRNSNVLAVGAGSVFVSLVAALFESGLGSVNVVITEGQDTNTERIHECCAQARQIDTRAKMYDLSSNAGDDGSFRSILQQMDAVVYVSETGNMGELQRIQLMCSEAGKLFLPAICIDRVGIVGPTTWSYNPPGTNSTWTSAWRRIHRSVFDNQLNIGTSTSTSGAIVANVLVFELFKAITGVDDARSDSRFYAVNLETLEGSWHRFFPHPCAQVEGKILRAEYVYERLSSESVSHVSDLLTYFGDLTDATSGIFHVWGEGDLPQLPLAQCHVQPVDPLSHGPAELLPITACSGLTHEDARREAGLTGIENYVLRLAQQFPSRPERAGALGDDHQTGSRTGGDEFIAVGAGATVAEALWRGLHQCLAHELYERHVNMPPIITPVKLTVHDDKCKFYLDALLGLNNDPVIGLGDHLFGLPVVWVGGNGGFVGSVGLSVGMALQHAIGYALLHGMRESDDEVLDARRIAHTSAAVVTRDVPKPVVIELGDGPDIGSEQLRLLIQSLARHDQEVVIRDLVLEPFLTRDLAGVFGVSMREGGSQ